MGLGQAHRRTLRVEKVVDPFRTSPLHPPSLTNHYLESRTGVKRGGEMK